MPVVEQVFLDLKFSEDLQKSGDDGDKRPEKKPSKKQLKESKRKKRELAEKLRKEVEIRPVVHLPCLALPACTKKGVVVCPGYLCRMHHHRLSKFGVGWLEHTG